MRIRTLVLIVLLRGPGVALSGQTPRSAYEELQNFSGVLNYIRLNYPDSVSYSDLVTAAIRGMLRSLDPHSYYVSRAGLRTRDALDRGELFGVGLALEAVDDAATVLAVLPKSAADKAGILPGDRVVRLNDTSVAGLDMQTLQIRLAGPKGSKVRLQLERGSRLEPDTFSVTLKRDPFEMRAVSFVRMLDAQTGYLRLEEFTEKAGDQVHDALGRLRDMQAQRVILDLRGNPGGIITSAVDVASEFFPKNTVVFRTRGRRREADTTFTTKHNGSFSDLPLIVLVDERSASAAEALSGSLQDHDRALLVGRRTFGKALMQTVFLLPSGDNVWLTIGHVVTPNGRFIQRRYRGIGYEQYLSYAGTSGAQEDTTAVFKTDNGRPVRGGGGIVPDVYVPLSAPLPIWWSAAADSGFDDAVSDSVAHTLPQTPAARMAWLMAEQDWRAKLLPPFLARVRSRLGVAAPTDSLLAKRLSRTLAARVAEVRWGSDAWEEFLVRNDPTIRVALDQFPRLNALLSPK
ncbi:MAG TPA: S41 family peptidase [Gemmatimonadales bacterium]|nr:S41 family peptidase [Gemmatimonadales bacterium]